MADINGDVRPTGRVDIGLYVHRDCGTVAGDWRTQRRCPRYGRGGIYRYTYPLASHFVSRRVDMDLYVHRELARWLGLADTKAVSALRAFVLELRC